jgi:predicted nucleic acid-binding protein
MLILDTSVLSELMRREPAAQVLTWAQAQSHENVYTTAISEAEMLYGLELLPRGKRRDELKAAMQATFYQDMAGHILAFDSEAARLYAQIAASRRKLGNPISYADAQIAAIVQLRGAILATRNVADFANCGIRVLDPWKE